MQMLTDRVFDYGLQLLADRGWGELAPSIKTVWRKYFDANLDDREFSTAINHAIIHCYRLPTAAELVEFAKGPLETQALHEWQRIVQAATNAQQPEVSDRALSVLAIIGGLDEVGYADQFQTRQLQQKFVKAYCKPYVPSLPSSKPVEAPQPMQMPEWGLPGGIGCFTGEISKKEGTD
ncbi:MAG: hypothetical protein F6K31_29355 [Symploca sp. SIO2G7]|nr:hypothetical protein [Symploca sp. SIO2G7]